MGYITRQMPHYSCSAASRLLLGARAIQVPPGRSVILHSFSSLLRCCKLFGMRPGTASRLAYRLSRILNRRRLEFLLSIVCNSNKPIRSSFNGTPEGYKAADLLALHPLSSLGRGKKLYKLLTTTALWTLPLFISIDLCNAGSQRSQVSGSGSPRSEC